MFDISKYDFSFRPSIELPDNDGKYWVLDDDDELVEHTGTQLSPGTGADGKDAIHYQGQVDVAYMAVESSLSDILNVTMHRDGDVYRLVSRTEIPENDEVPAFQTTFADVPTFGELLRALDGMEGQYSRDVDRGWVQETIPMVTISSIGSGLYPQLEDWYFAVQDHFFNTGELVYVQDPLGESVEIKQHSKPQPERMTEKVPGSGSIFAATPETRKRMFSEDAEKS